MKKIIVVLLILVSGIISCEINYGIAIGNIYDYDFPNDIPNIDSINDAIKYVVNNMKYAPENDDYWQTPEETYWRLNEYGEMLGDCEDFSIFLGYLLYNKLNIENVFIVRINENGNHIIVYCNGDFIEPQNGIILNSDFTKSKVLFYIPYSEAIWMTINYHDSIGKYE